MPTPEENKAAFRPFQDAANTHDAELISKTIDELVEPDALIRTPLPIEATGAQLLKEVFARLHRAYPDLHVTYNEIFICRLAEGRIAETWGVVDVLSQMRQLGAMPGGT